MGRVLGWVLLSAFLPLCAFGKAVDDSKVWIPALEHLSPRGMTDSFQSLSDRWVELRSSNSDVHLYILEHHIKRKDRQALNRYVAQVWRRNSCAPFAPAEELVQIASVESAKDAPERVSGKSVVAQPVDSSFCYWLQKKWRDDLSPLLFYDATASLLEDVRSLLVEKKCTQARDIVERLIRREGENIYLLENLETIAECLEDEAFEASVAVRLKKLEELRL